MTLPDYLENILREILVDKSTKTETLIKLYSHQKLFTLEDISEAWAKGYLECIRDLNHIQSCHLKKQ